MKKVYCKIIMGFCATVLISACGGGSSGSSSPDSSNSNTATALGDTGCPGGLWYSTNGYSDYINVGSDGRVAIQFKSGAISNGFASCTGNQLTLDIVAGGQKTNYCLGGVCADHFVSQGVGTYSCVISSSASMFQVYCAGGSDLDGNLFNPARTYWVQ